MDMDQQYQFNLNKPLVDNVNQEDLIQKKEMSHLYHQDVSELKFGYKTGEHATHIIKKHGTGPIGWWKSTMQKGEKELNPMQVQNMKKLSLHQGDIYYNKSTEKDRVFFTELAQYSAREYEKTLNKGWHGRGGKLRDVMSSVREYVTATKRSDQQDKLADLYDKISTTETKIKSKSILYQYNKTTKQYELKPNLDEVEIESWRNSVAGQELTSIEKLEKMLNAKTRGLLELPKEEKMAQIMAEPLHEPKSHIVGARWADVSKQELFPHEPNVNDIKQGIGVQDCFMLSSTSVLAYMNSENITRAMKDLGDGTVLVRFYAENAANNNQMEPVYVRVKKTVRHMAGANMYASSSLWVQLLEKAYVKYVEHYHHNKDRDTGYAQIQTGNAGDFLAAFTGQKYQRTSHIFFGIGSSADSDTADLKQNPSLEIKNKRYLSRAKKNPGGEYTEEENKIYDYLERRIANNEVIITGYTEQRFPTKNSYDDFVASKGIHKNHAYGVLRVFEDGGKKYVVLRDPYASFTAKYDSKGNLMDHSKLGVGATLEGGDVDNMGQFVLELFDYMRLFNSIQTEKKNDDDNDLPCIGSTKERQGIIETRYEEPVTEYVPQAGKPAYDGGGSDEF